MGSTISWSALDSIFCCSPDPSPRLINVTPRDDRSLAGRFSLYRRSFFLPGFRDVLHDWPYELDSYDDRFAEYLVVNDPSAGTQLGALRLLRTDRPHVLGSIFPDLCRDAVPSGFAIREITQIYLSPKIHGKKRRAVAVQLASALIQYGLLMGIESFTTVIETVWSDFLPAMGWQCKPLGPPLTVDRVELGAYQIHVEIGAVEALRASSCYVECDLSVLEAHHRSISLQ